MDAIDKAVWLGDKKFGKLEFLAAFQSFCNQTFKPTIICHAFKSIGLVLFNSNIVFDKICEKQALKAQTVIQTSAPLPLPLHQRTPQGPILIVKYGQRQQKAYAKLKLGEIVDSEQIQWFIYRSIASSHIFELTAWDLKAIQETMTAWAKRANLAKELAQKSGRIEVREYHILCLKKKEKEK